LAETAKRQSEGALARFHRSKKALEERTGLTYGLDNQTQYLATDSDRSPSVAASNVTRFYGVWTATGRGTPDDGALVFKVEYRTALGNKISTQALGPSLGYAGVFSSTYSDAGAVLTNLYWRQHFAGGRGGFVVGQVDPYDYVNVNSLSSPWTAFTNLAFEQQPTLPAPPQGLGAAARWRLDENWQVLAGFADANADPSEPWESAKDFFDEFETFKHVAIGWAPDWASRYDETLQLTIWQIDERTEAGVEDGYGAAFTASGRRDKWRPFLRFGYAKDAGAVLERAVSIGTGYDARGGKDLAGLGVSWGRAPDNSRDQYTAEAFYRYDMTDFLQLTPEIQYVVNPANDPATDDILVLGFRLRAFF
jgi:porin